MRKKSIVFVILAIICSLPFCGVTEANAGKPEAPRLDFQGTLDPILKMYMGVIKDACRCPVAISVQAETYTSPSHISKLGSALESIKNVVLKKCKSPEGKKAFCANASRFVISGGSCPKCADRPKAKDGVIEMQSSDAAFTTVEQLNAIVEKW